MELILDGAVPRDLLQFAAQQQWNLRAGQLPRYIAKARELIREGLDVDLQHTADEALASRRRLFAQSKQVGDYATAHRIAVDIAKMQGLYPGTSAAPTRIVAVMGPTPAIDVDATMKILQQRAEESACQGQDQSQQN